MVWSDRESSQRKSGGEYELGAHGLAGNKMYTEML